MTEQDRAEKQQQISDLAEKLLDKEIAKGSPFSEGLCNWAVNKAEQILGSIPK